MIIISRSAAALSTFLFFSSFGAAQAQNLNHAPTPADLGTLGGSSSQANAINSSAGIVGWANVTGDTAQHAFLLPHGATVLQDLGVLSGGVNSIATAVNAKSQVAGYSDFNDPVNGLTTHGFLYNKGVLTDVGTLGGPISEANGINNRGLVVGFSLLSDDATTHAFLYDSEKSVISDLGVLKGGNNSAAYAINRQGIVAGSSETGAVDSNGFSIVDAVLFFAPCDDDSSSHPGKILDLGNLGASPAQASALNDYTEVVGFSAAADGNIHGFFWENGVLTDIGNLGGSFTQATAVNDKGQVVGLSNIAADSDEHAFIWTKHHGIIDLNSIIPANSGWDLNAAYGIDNEGKIVGAGTFNGQTHAFSLKYPTD